MATLPGAWHYRVSAGTGWPGVSILWLGEVERWICNLSLSVAARKIVWADPSLRYTSLLLGRSAANKQTNLPFGSLSSYLSISLNPLPYPLPYLDYHTDTVRKYSAHQSFSSEYGAFGCVFDRNMCVLWWSMHAEVTWWCIFTAMCSLSHVPCFMLGASCWACSISMTTRLSTGQIALSSQYDNR